MKKRDILRAGAAIIAGLAGWGLLRFAFPAFGYFPPESLTSTLERSWLTRSGLREPAGAVYLGLALVWMALFFRVVQRRWPGRGSVKGLIFGTALGGVWSFGFLAGWAFLGTTLRAELLNVVADLFPMAIAGWFIGLALGSDVGEPEDRPAKPWLAVILVAVGFVAVHTAGSRLFTELLGTTTGLLLVPTAPLQVALLFGLGLWVGGMYVVLRAGLPLVSRWARVGFFAFGIFGHSWTWFNLFFVIEFAGVGLELILLGLVGAVGVFAGALAYERLARQDGGVGIGPGPRP